MSNAHLLSEAELRSRLTHNFAIQLERPFNEIAESSLRVSILAACFNTYRYRNLEDSVRIFDDIEKAILTNEHKPVAMYTDFQSIVSEAASVDFYAYLNDLGKRHAWTETAVLGAYRDALGHRQPKPMSRRLIVAVRALDRSLYMSLTGAERRNFFCLEQAGIVAHFKAEQDAGMAIQNPSITAAVEKTIHALGIA